MREILVKNMNGYELDFTAVIDLMDEDIREELHNEGYDTEQEFFTAYEKRHAEKFNEEWELSKENPCW